MGYRRAGAGELQQHRATDDLGIGNGKGAGQGGRCCGAQGGHGQKANRNAGFGQDQGAFDAFLVLDQRGDGAQDQGEHRTAAQLLSAAGQHRRHLDGVAGRFFAHQRLALHVLDGIVPGGVELVQWRRLAKVLSADHGPVESHGGQIVDDVGHAAYISLAGGATFPCLKVDGFDAAAIGTEVGDILRKVKVARWVAGADVKVARHSGHGLKDHVPGNLDDLTVVVHLSTVCVKDCQGLFRRELDAHVFEYVQRRFLDLIQLPVAQELHSEIGPNGLDCRAFNGHLSGFLSRMRFRRAFSPDSSCPGFSCLFQDLVRVEGIPESIADVVDGNDGQEYHQTRKKGQPRLVEHVVHRVAQ